MSSNYWVGKRTSDDEAILVYDPGIQTSETHVYLFNYHTAEVEWLDRAETRKVISKVCDLSEQQLAIEAYLNWLRTDAGKRLIRSANNLQSAQLPPDKMHEFYSKGYWDGYYNRNERFFDSRTSENCRREYNRGYMDGANEFDMEQNLIVENLSDDEAFFFDSYPDLRSI